MISPVHRQPLTGAADPHSAYKTKGRPISLLELVEMEHRILNNGDVDPPKIASPSSSHEPWVRFTARDYFGLGLSGGGIRSATFNLGLLQALDEKEVLNSVDYLSTVSGGGYAGGFWNTWLLRQRRATAAKASTFPNEQSNPPGSAAGLSDPREPAPIRHLREYSRFIIPRVGFRQSDTWNAVIAVLGGVLPSVVTSLCLLALVSLLAYQFAVFLVLDTSGILSAVAFGLATLVFQSSFLTRRAKSATSTSKVAISALGAVFSLAAWTFVPRVLVLLALKYHWVERLGAHHINLLSFAPAVAWLVAAVMLIILRALLSRFLEDTEGGAGSAQIDRAAGLCLAPALVAAFMAGVWELGLYLQSNSESHALGVSAATTTVAGSLLFALRNWLSKKITDPSGGSFTQQLTANLKPFVPRALSSIVFLSLILVATLLVQMPWPSEHRGWVVAICAVQIALALLLFDPLKVGMHDFYRRRIRDCFLAAAYAGQNKASDANLYDPTLGKLRQELEAAGEGTEAPRRPIHLVCCTANNLAGDTLTSLYRGSRSAVLSPFGISLGGVTATQDDLRLSAALTASAAAFNSQMGQLSMAWGSAVAFAMSTFNLRLGLWVRHPSNPDERQFDLLPGSAFFYELFGMTSCDPLEAGHDGTGRTEPGGFVQRQRQHLRYLHLSDGGHFENLGLYELVRRHCRYIIISDCGADGDIKFDDLANAIRRVREDFGVQVELDVEPLRPGDAGTSAQHAVVGTIHYDGLYGSDKGTLLYIKPTITGDEPADVLQHRSRYPQFPHDTTAEQFYDEAQWESYRALGQHVVRAVLSFLERPKLDEKRFVENLFLNATESWRPALPRQEELYSSLTEQCREVESDIRQNAPEWLREEFFPEVAAALGKAGAPHAVTLKETTQAVYFLMGVIQIMEDVWVAAQLDKYWSHPMSQGWMTYFQRWASTPVFRTWWPILRPMYSNGLHEFVKERFGIRIRDAHETPEGPMPPGATLELGAPATAGELRGLAADQWTRTAGPFGRPRQPAIDYSFTLAGADASLHPIQVAFLLYAETAGSVAWHCNDLFVPHALVGGGIMARFLDRLIAHFRTEGRTRIEVTISDGAGRRVPNRAARWAMVGTINFYKSRGFVYSNPESASQGVTTLTLDLRASSPGPVSG